MAVVDDAGINTSLNHKLVKLINKPTKNTGISSLAILIPLERKANISKSFAKRPNTVIVANKIDIGIAIPITYGSLRIITNKTVMKGILYLTAVPIKSNNTVLPNRMIVNAKIPLKNGVSNSFIIYRSINFIN